MSLASSDITARLRGYLSGVDKHSAPQATVDLNVVTSLAPGVSASQADTIWEDQRTLAASANETLDLAGALLDDLGAAAVFVKVKAIMIRASAANVNSVIVGAAASNPFLGPLGGTTPTLTIPPGGFVLLAAPIAGWSSANAAADSLKIANSGGTTGVTYDIVVIGTSA